MITAEYLIDEGWAKKDTMRRCANRDCNIIVIKDGEKYCKPCRWAGRETQREKKDDAGRQGETK